MSILELRDFCVKQTELISGFDYHVKNVCKYDNLKKWSGNFGKHLKNDVYIARSIEIKPFIIGLLPSRSEVYGGSFIVGSENNYLEDQLPPGSAKSLNDFTLHNEQFVNEEFVNEECLLLARYGHNTWGHWMGELLPKAVIAEKKFKYVVSKNIIENEVQSLSYYGINKDRLVFLDPKNKYIFNNLSATSKIYDSLMFNPKFAEELRGPLKSRVPGKKIAFFRGGLKRIIINQSQIRQFLEKDKWEVIDIEKQTFKDQITLFMEAEYIFSNLGSGLSGLLYCDKGIKVISAAPAKFGDRFFYAMIQEGNGFYADLRGEIKEIGSVPDRDDNFILELPSLRKAILALEAF